MRHVSRSTRLLLVAAALVTVGGVAAVTVGVPAAASRPVVTPLARPLDRAVPQPPQASRSRALVVRPVAALHKLLTPDLLISTKAPLTPAQSAGLHHLLGVTGATVVGSGALNIGGRPLHAVGVDPSEFRAFTPRETASSNALWAAVARGDLASSYAARLPLGASLHVVGSGGERRVGAVADYGLPEFDVVLDKVAGARLGLRDTLALVTAPDRRIRSLERDVRSLLGARVTFTVLRPVAITYRRPSTYRELYMLSARYCPGLSWTVLAAIGQVESGHGRNVGPSSAGALGPMQFLPSTWASSGVDGDGDGKADIMSPYDAVPAAALYLCRNGAGRGGQSLYNAIFSYNHADWYVREVLALAAAYK